MLAVQSRLTLCNPVDCSSPGSSVHGILQARILQWAAIPFLRGSSWPRIEPESPILQADSLTSEPPGNMCKQVPQSNVCMVPKCGYVTVFFLEKQKWVYTGPISASLFKIPMNVSKSIFYYHRTKQVMERQIIFIFTYFVGNFIYNGETSRRVWGKKKKKPAFGGCSKGPSSFQRVSNMNKFHISVPIRE